MCSTSCLECYHPGSYCRQCVYPLALDTFNHKCLPCCSSNVTTNNCCQCSPSWDGKCLACVGFSFLKSSSAGFCLHPLATSVNDHLSWFKTSLHQLRHQFKSLKSSRQILFICFLGFSLIGVIICLITLALRQMSSSHLSSIEDHNNVEYVMLENVDDDDQLETSMSLNGSRKGSNDHNGHTRKEEKS